MLKYGKARADDRAAYRQGVLLLSTVVLVWGLTWPVNKVILESLPPLWMAALRSGIATIALFAIAIFRGRLARPRRSDLPVLLTITLFHMVGFTVFSSIGLALVPAGRSAVLAYTTPLWVTPGASLFLKERLTVRRAGGVVAGLCGLALLFNPLAFDWTNHEAVLGNAALLFAAFLWAASILHIRGHSWHATPFDLVPWETLLATLLLTLIASAFEPFPSVRWTATLIALLLYAGVAGTALAYWAAAMASRNLPAVTTSLGSLATPVISIGVATFMLGETPSTPLLAAVALILGGVAIGTTGARPRPSTDPAKPGLSSEARIS